jgi:alkylation response protein AidB-like acyl-CoA dehydrogenase
MTTASPESTGYPVLQNLPTDEVRQLLWRFSDRYDLQMVVQSARAVGRGPVARLVADGARNTHEWTEGKSRMLNAFDEAGLTSLCIDPEYGGYLEGPKNLALALAAFELAWVDSGAATCSLAGGLALEPILEKGTPEQKQRYLSRCVPGAAGGGEPARGAFCLTEPLPFVGVDTGVLSGKIRVAEWKDDEPILQVDKRGRFTTNMDFATFVVAAVESDDPRIRGTCMVIVEEGDEGVFDRGAPTHKLAHQLSSTRDPILNLKVPASRIIGGYTIQDGVLVPNVSHGKVLESVFARTRVPVGVMTAAKLLSTVEPVIRYQRGRFRGGEGMPGTPRHDLGLQMKEDALQRLVDVWATGEAAASLGFASARHLDSFDTLDHRRDELYRAAGATGGRELLKVRKAAEQRALEYLALSAKPEADRDADRLDELARDELVQLMVSESLSHVLTPATKLWNTGFGATMLREAVSLMGGYGITEDCPGFLPQKWFDAQLDATYEGPESVQRRQLVMTMTSELFLAQFGQWVKEMRQLASDVPASGACTLGSAMELWLWTLRHLREAKDADGKPLYRDRRQGATFPMADALCWLLAARFQILDVLELQRTGAERPDLADALPGQVQFLTDLCHVQSARAAGEVGRICAELVFGYQRHPSWDPKCEACYSGDEVDDLEGLIPGFAAGTRGRGEVLESDGYHPPKAGPCVRFAGLETFQRLRGKLDGCLAGARLAKDRAGHALTEVSIPEALDYPA